MQAETDTRFLQSSPFNFDATRGTLCKLGKLKAAVQVAKRKKAKIVEAKVVGDMIC